MIVQDMEKIFHLVDHSFNAFMRAQSRAENRFNTEQRIQDIADLAKNNFCAYVDAAAAKAIRLLTDDRISNLRVFDLNRDRN